LSSPGSKDYYNLLGVTKDATASDIKKAYRQLVRKYHPDANPGNKEAEEHFKEVNEAYEVLADPDKRAQYDQFGTVGDFPGGGPFSGFGGVEDVFGDLFENLFGFGTSGRRRVDPNAPRRGSDIETQLIVNLEEAAEGVSRTVEIPRWQSCERCSGSGAEPGTQPEVCPQCHGTGQVETQQRTPFGQFVSINTCPRCQGKGKYIKHPCQDCKGEGRVRRNHSVEVKVVPGVDTGTRLRIPGEGQAGINGGPNGDLFLVVNVPEHEIFKRDGTDLHEKISVPFPQAALGGELKIPTLIDGTEDLEIPPGSQPGEVFRIRGKGMPRLRGHGRGDLYVHMTLDVPRKLTEKQKELLEELASEMGLKVSGKGMLGKFRKVFGG